MSGALRVNLLNAAEVGAEWDAFVDRSAQASVFAKSFWLRGATNGEFQIAVTRDERGVIVAGLPIYLASARSGERRLIMPEFTQTLGPMWESASDMRPHQQITWQVAQMSALLDALPPHAVYRQLFHPNVSNLLPFLWRNYRVSCSYTYRFESLADLTAVRSSYADLRRREIKRSAKVFAIREDITPEDFYQFQLAARLSDGEKPRFSWTQYSALVRDAQSAVKTLGVVTSDGRVVAAVALAWDSHCCYYLLPAVLAGERKSGCVAFLIDQAIEWASKNSKAFDFEGSSTFGIEEYYRYFGAKLVPLYRAERDKRSAFTRLLEWSALTTRNLATLIRK